MLRDDFAEAISASPLETMASEQAAHRTAVATAADNMVEPYEPIVDVTADRVPLGG
jgi:hypothetical protein